MPTLDESTDAHSVEAEMEGLIQRAQGIIDGIVGYYRRRQMLERADGEDVTSTVRVRLLQKLQRLRAGEGEPIATYDGYVARLTYNAVNDVFRGRFPQRTLLKKRIRDIARSDSRFVLETTVHGEACRLREQTGGVIVAPVDVRSLPSDVADAMETLLRTASGPLLLHDLLAAIGCDPGRPQLKEASSDDSPLLRLERREDVQKLWSEILQLPVPQRTALLLNLRSEGSGCAIALLILLGVTTFDELAVALGMSSRDLAALWADLPLDDLTIGERLGVTRQQVINLRKAARKRLERRTGRRGAE